MSLVWNTLSEKGSSAPKTDSGEINTNNTAKKLNNMTLLRFICPTPFVFSDTVLNNDM
jgi:hypothetical protein